jgi:2-oxoglutarate ferredoxin oxidoreductase subunit alpha
MTRSLMEGSEAIAEACIAAGCRFFSGYPMTPFTELLEHMARRLPEEGGACINSESELEAVGQAWGAAATGNRAATGSTGQGLALMQESMSEMTRAELPIVIFNMARGQGDYYQATRGGGHGDYRTIVLAPATVNEAVEITQLAFHLADQWRHPVLIYGDYLIAHTAEAVEVDTIDFGPLPEKTWAVDGSLGGTGKSKNLNPIGMEKGSKGIEPNRFWNELAQKEKRMTAAEQRWEHDGSEDDEYLIVAFGTMARFARASIRDLREQGYKVGLFRPITLWPFPSEALVEAARGKKRIAVLEQNSGQMIDDVQLSLLGSVPLTPIGGISTDPAGFGVGAILDSDLIASRARDAFEGKSVDTGVI